MATVPFVDSSEFYRLLTKSEETPVLLSFWLEWVGPCHVFLPRLELVQQQTPLTCYRADGDKSPDLVSRYHVEYYPTNLIIVNGGVRERFVGECNRGELETLLVDVLPEYDRGDFLLAG